MKAWTNREVERLRKLYPSASWAEITRELHPRSPASITKMANKLEIKRSATANGRCRDWMEVADKHQPMVFWGPKE
jgi:hypothetical protein